MLDAEYCRLDMIDTCPHRPEFAAMRTHYYSLAHGFVLIYSVTDRDSFDQIQTFCGDIASTIQRESFPLVIVGNKCDDQDRRQVSKEEGEAMAAQWSAKFMESSAKAGVNIDEIWVEIVREIRMKNATAAGTNIKKDTCSVC